ncbi:hypothetical protein [Pseudomonas sp. M47T1]|uniref:hypothetical protein n=1 Tax=Pseudomonas sp. M47T1 TaxID=1179778 RepID=UPI0012FA6DC7|nr:hypothetical protein [Pseudomonas sp. M47T1]
MQYVVPRSLNLKVGCCYFQTAVARNNVHAESIAYRLIRGQNLVIPIHGMLDDGNVSKRIPKFPNGGDYFFFSAARVYRRFSDLLFYVGADPNFFGFQSGFRCLRQPRDKVDFVFLSSNFFWSDGENPMYSHPDVESPIAMAPGVFTPFNVSRFDVFTPLS